MTPVLSALPKLLALIVAFVVAVGSFTLAREQGWLAFLGLDPTGDDDQVVLAIERTEEVSLLALSVEGIDTDVENRSVLGFDLPGTGKTILLRYAFTAKLGVDGTGVDVSRTGEHDYTVTVPEFSFIGYDEPSFEVLVDDGGALSFTTPEVDQAAMVTDILGDGERAQYLAEQDEGLRDQTRVFYDNLITSVDPQAVTRYEFAS